ncbi:hypothetical protein TrST_g12103 [Triparma strigata]|uniref:C2H2-type domain-containing protein n=1 Tax=Triparma strigata TaxID=1606541 RepID=A0A9W7EBK3_9STRA|nr:hypothetical protein TrST_g12103 [Triparma strigata]
MSGNDSVSLSQLAPGSNVVSSPGGGGAMDTLNNGGFVSGVVYQDLRFRTDVANATPMTGYDDESVATDITEGDLDDGSVIFAGGGGARGGARGGLARDKWGNIIRTCGIAGCQYKTGNTTNMKNHKAAKHGIDVVWFSCDQDGCDYKVKQAGDLKKHKANFHDIDVNWHHCDQDGCDYKAKLAGTLKQHKQMVHDIDIRDGCDYKAKAACTLKSHKASVHDIDVRWHHCDQDFCTYKAKLASTLKSHKRRKHS